MHNIMVNNQTMAVADNSTISQLITLAGFADQAIAVAVNGEFVPKAQYGQTTLSHNDAVDIVKPIGGG
ncbi:MAG: sulfur carrier protein ThiS [Oceanospirillaceae bacterium]|nr:sulfur carrier protein ThiS [Oceanospirillaceae bacterium]